MSKPLPKWKQLQLEEEKRVAQLKIAEQEVRVVVDWYCFLILIFFFFALGQIEKVARVRIDRFVLLIII